MKKSRLAKLLAYIYIPVIFCLIGYLILGFVLEPVWQTASGAFSLLSADYAPNFESQLSSIYNPEAKNENPVELHTEVIEEPQTEVSKTMQVTDADPQEIEEAEQAGQKFIRFEFLEPQMAYIYVRDVDSDVEQRAGYMYVRKQENEDGQESSVALIYPGEQDAGSEDEETVTPYEMVLDEDLEDLQGGESQIAFALDDSENGGEKTIYYVDNGAQEAAALQHEILKKIQVIYQETAASETHEYIHIQDVEYPLVGAEYASLSCDRIDLKCPVYWGDTDEILRYGAGQYLASMMPGFGRIIVLSAHNNTFFTPLQNIAVKDEIHFDTNYCAYTYEVTDVQVLDENELLQYIMEHLLEEKEELILYTCYPFEATVGRKTDRLTVFAKRTSGYDVKWRNLDE